MSQLLKWIHFWLKW